MPGRRPQESLEFRNGLFEFLPSVVGDSKIQANRMQLGRQAQRLPIGGDGLIVTVQPHQHRTQIGVRFGVGGRGCQNGTIFSFSCGEVAAALQFGCVVEASSDFWRLECRSVEQQRQP